ncbi:hypothetical protein TWF506_010461 [Arthrobotrys conoides]|uniref:Uncharacterized protein n=1 Tax=Arthrobotrys conoides TaxID=74498 RepID=A0AAN8RKY1_9PEZI
MGRYLPWRDGPVDESRPKKRVKAGPVIDDLRAKKDKDEEAVRDDQYMRPGIKNDDQYIMVEDEFLQIAKSYTAKLHSAELARLQAQISLRKSQKVAVSQHSQPRIPGSMPKKRQVVLQRRAHDAAIRKAAGIQTDKDAEEGSYNPKFSSQSLGRLMTTSAVRIDSVLPLPLTPGKAIKPATRAAAGFTKASFKKTTSSPISPSQVKSSQIAMEEYNDNYSRESYDEDEEDLDLMPRRSSSIRIPSKLTPIERPTSSYASDKRISISKQPLRSNYDSKSKLLSSSPQGSQKPSLLSSSPPQRPSRTFNSPAKSGLSIADSDSDNDYADAEQAARWRRRSLPNPSAISSSTIKPIPAHLSTKPRPAIPKFSDDDDFADAEQAARFRKRRQLAEAQRSGPKS